MGRREAYTVLVARVWHLGMCMSGDEWAPAPLGRVGWLLSSMLCLSAVVA